MNDEKVMHCDYNDYKKIMLKYENLAKRLENELTYRRCVDRSFIFQYRILSKFSPVEIFKINYMLKMMDSDCEIVEDDKGLIFVDKIAKEKVIKFIDEYKKMKLRKNIINGISIILLVIIVLNFIK